MSKHIEAFEAKALAEEIEEYAREINPEAMKGQLAIYQMAKVRWAINDLGAALNELGETIDTGVKTK